MSETPILQSKGLHLYYGEAEALKGIDMQIQKNEITALIGPSGCGKSTFLKTLDPGSTLRIEDLMAELKEKYTVVIVTHNMQQAGRISDRTAFFLLGELVEYGPTKELVTTPRDKRTEDYITGRFG